MTGQFGKKEEVSLSDNKPVEMLDFNLKIEINCKITQRERDNIIIFFFNELN